MAKAMCCDCRKVFDDADLLEIKKSDKHYFNRTMELLDNHADKDYQALMARSVDLWKDGFRSFGLMEGMYTKVFMRKVSEKFPGRLLVDAEDRLCRFELLFHALHGESDIRSEAILFEYLLAMDQPPEMRAELERWSSIVPLREIPKTPYEPVRWTSTQRNIRMYDILPR